MIKALATCESDILAAKNRGAASHDTRAVFENLRSQGSTFD
jgi:hypothetical protein